MLNFLKQTIEFNTYYFNFYWGYYFFSAGYFAMKNNKYVRFNLRSSYNNNFAQA